MRLAVVNTVVEDVIREDALPSFPAFVDVDVRFLAEGPPSIECRLDEARAVPAVLDEVAAAVADGADGVVLNCFMDPALEPARELVHVPVAGPGQSSMVLATLLGQRFSVILPAASGAPIAEEQARRYVGGDRLASVRSVEMPVAELHDHGRLVEGLVEQAERAIRDDDAHVVIVGCTGMCAVIDGVRDALAHHDVPVIDPTLAAVGAVVSQLVLDVHHSGPAYALPAWRMEAR